MANLETTYLGLTLKNPIIIGACNLSLDLDMARKLEDGGAAAIVFKSLFEEQINLESLEMQEELDQYNERHAEMITQHPNLEHAGPEGHLDMLSQLKKHLSIPVIGSLNCVNRETWADYALEMEKTGVDALELNFYSTMRNYDTPAQEIEAEQIQILEEIVAKVKLPISVKLSPFYSNTLHVIKQMDQVGVKGFVLFNRLFQPDIDLEKQEHTYPFNLSQIGDYRLPLRYAGLLFGQVKANICSNTGIFTGDDVIRMVLAGADSVQVVSTVYRNKEEYLGKMLNDINHFMDQKGYGKLSDFKGDLSRIRLKDPYAYHRAQYVDLLMKPFEIMKRYPQV
ncbi:MAG: dihydroorotate dehydrogenase-like protein [Bacteroidales bacterium]